MRRASEVGIWGQYYKTFLGIIYATSGVFPCDFDLGYTDSNVIMSKKFYNIGRSGLTCVV